MRARNIVQRGGRVFASRECEKTPGNLLTLAASHLQLVDELLRECGVVRVLAGRARTQHGVLRILLLTARHIHTGETAVLRDGASHVEGLLL